MVIIMVRFGGDYNEMIFIFFWGGYTLLANADQIVHVYKIPTSHFNQVTEQSRAKNSKLSKSVYIRKTSLKAA